MNTPRCTLLAFSSVVHHSRRTIGPLTLPLLLTCLSLGSVSAQGTIRTWTDATGRFKIEAELLRFEEGKVFLKTSDGRTLQIAVEKLSQEDQQFAKENKVANPFEEIGPEAGASQTGAMTSSIGQTNWKDAEEIALIGGTTWKVPLRETSGLDFEPQTVPLPKKLQFFEKQQPLVINPGIRRASIGYVTSFSVPEPITRLVLADLSTGRMVSGDPVEGVSMRPIALLHDGKTTLMGGTDKKLPVGPEGLQPWAITRSGLQRGEIWKPYATMPGATGSEEEPLPVGFAAAVAGDVLMTCSNKGHLVAWDFAERQPRWYTNLGGEPAYALTPDGRLMALIAGGQLIVLDVTDGNPVGKLPLGELGHLPWPNLAFSPSSRRLFLSSMDRVLILDMESGEWVQDAKIAGMSTQGGIGFPHEDFVLINGRYLVHWESRLKLWDYSDMSAPIVIGGKTFVGKNEDGGGSLLVLDIPHDRALQTLDEVQARSDLFVVHPGAKIRIDVSQVPEKYRDAVESGLAQQIKKIGCAVAENAPVTLLASITGPTTEAASYHMAGAHVVKKYVSSVKLQYDGKELWTGAATNIPGFLSLKRGETVKDALARLSKTPNVDYFSRISLPEYLQKPGLGSDEGPKKGVATIGHSKVAISGIEDA